MMSEIVDDSYSGNFALYFQTTLHTFESSKRFRNGFCSTAVLKGYGSGSRRVVHVVFSGKCHPQVRPQPAVVLHLPGGFGITKAQIANSPRRTFFLAVALHLTESLGDAF